MLVWFDLSPLEEGISVGDKLCISPFHVVSITEVPSTGPEQKTFRIRLTDQTSYLVLGTSLSGVAAIINQQIKLAQPKS